MKVAISQPTYLPWLGYFDQVDQVDRFVFLDTVQFEKRSWQQRNQIKGPEGLILLTVPVQVKGRFDQQIWQAAISDMQCCQTHLNSIQMNYRRAPFFEKYWIEFSKVLQEGWATGRLAELNTALISWCMRKLGISTPIMRTSELGCEGKKGELLARICESLGARCYLSAFGSATYLLEAEAEFSKRQIEVEFHHYEHPEYNQRFPPFVPYASVIDLIFNLGDRAIDVLRSGRRRSFSCEDVRKQSAEKAEA
ncbi:MAG TPA: WbqC family protein [Candidatus Sulfotelmatobacter sp.]|nr:WbqC family protein [Candidatus Sulfotelmatobacter sp.]